MEANKCPPPAARRELERFECVHLFPDGEGESFSAQQRLQRERLSTVALLPCAIVRADGSRMATRAGLTRNQAGSVAFLRTPGAGRGGLPPTSAP